MEKIWILLLPLLGMLRFVPPFTEFADEPGPSDGPGFLNEDGSGDYIMLLESGLGYVIQE
jgi:hypothetical protein